MPSLYRHKCVPVLVCMFLHTTAAAAAAIWHIGMYCVLSCRNEIHMWPHTNNNNIFSLYRLSFLVFFFASVHCFCCCFVWMWMCVCLFFFFTSNSFQRFSYRRHHRRRQNYYCHISNRLLFFSLIPYFKSFKPIHRTFESRSECTV